MGSRASFAPNSPFSFFPSTPSDALGIVNCAYPPVLLGSLNELRENEQLCDVELEAEGETIHAHRVVLAASIPYFRSMFVSSQMKETNQRRIVLSDISSEALRQLIKYVYTSRMSITVNNVQELLFAASILQMDTVAGYCEHYMAQKLRAQTCISLHLFAEQHNFRILRLSTEAFAVEHFSEIRLMSDFLSIPFTLIRDLIARSDLNVNNEQEVFETMVQWLGEDPPRRAHLPDLLQHVRLMQLSCRYLQDVVMKHPFIATEPSCVQQVAAAAYSLAEGVSGTELGSSSYNDAAMAVSSPNSSENTREYATSLPMADGETRERRTEQSPSDILRPPSLANRWACPRKSVAGVIFCVGGREEDDPFRSVEVYDWRRDRWFAIAEMTTPRRRVGVVFAHGRLYAIGGHDGSTILATAECYDPAEGMWKQVAPMHTSRRGIGVAALGDAIYAVGGSEGDGWCSQTVERYDIKSNSWTNVAQMNIPRKGAGVAALGKFLFAVGGSDGISTLDSCERYDPHLDKWLRVAEMRNSRGRVGVCVMDGFLYAIGGFDDYGPLDTCERYDMRKDEWTEMADMSCARGGVGVAAMGGLVYAIGGNDGDTYLDMVEAYDPELNQWSPVCSITECRVGAGVAWADVRVANLLSTKHIHESGSESYNGIAPSEKYLSSRECVTHCPDPMNLFDTLTSGIAYMCNEQNEAFNATIECVDASSTEVQRECDQTCNTQAVMFKWFMEEMHRMSEHGDSPLFPSSNQPSGKSNGPHSSFHSSLPGLGGHSQMGSPLDLSTMRDFSSDACQVSECFLSCVKNKMNARCDGTAGSLISEVFMRPLARAQEHLSALPMASSMFGFLLPQQCRFLYDTNRMADYRMDSSLDEDLKRTYREKKEEQAKLDSESVMPTALAEHISPFDSDQNLDELIAHLYNGEGAEEKAADPPVDTVIFNGPIRKSDRSMMDYDGSGEGSGVDGSGSGMEIEEGSGEDESFSFEFESPSDGEIQCVRV